MKAALRREYWWPCMVMQIERLVNSCPDCERSSKSCGSPYSPKGTVIPRPETPVEQWGLDISGPFYHGRCLVVLIDYASRFLEDTKPDRQSSDGWIPFGNAMATPQRSCRTMDLSSRRNSSRRNYLKEQNIPTRNWSTESKPSDISHG